MKACTKVHGELNVRLCRREVQEGADHALVLSLVNGQAVLIWMRHCFRAHHSLHGLELSHVELLHQIIHILGLMYEDAFLRLLHLNT
jgi:hypothetical protein